MSVENQIKDSIEDMEQAVDLMADMDVETCTFLLQYLRDNFREIVELREADLDWNGVHPTGQT